MNVSLPKLLVKAVLKPKFSKNPKEKIHKRLGQSMPIVSHNVKDPKKIQRTPIASLDKPPNGGIKRPKKHKATQIGIAINL